MSLQPVGRPVSYLLHLQNVQSRGPRDRGTGATDASLLSVHVHSSKSRTGCSSDWEDCSYSPSPTEMHTDEGALAPLAPVKLVKLCSLAASSTFLTSTTTTYSVHTQPQRASTQASHVHLRATTTHTFTIALHNQSNTRCPKSTPPPLRQTAMARSGSSSSSA